MDNTLALLEPEFLVIECTSTGTGAYSCILTSCQSETTVENACDAAGLELKEDVGQEIEFNVLTLKEFIEDSCILDEIKDGDRDGFDDVDQEQLSITNIFLAENLTLLHEIVDQLFETGYVNGIISTYVECDDVPILKASR